MTGERTLPADRRTAWAALNDVEVLTSCVPGCEMRLASRSLRFAILFQASPGIVSASEYLP